MTSRKPTQKKAALPQTYVLWQNVEDVFNSRDESRPDTEAMTEFGDLYRELVHHITQGQLSDDLVSAFSKAIAAAFYVGAEQASKDQRILLVMGPAGQTVH